MLEVAEALEEVLARVRAPRARSESLWGALGRVLAEDVRADADAPPFDKSLRDGYAVRAADCAAPNVELKVVAEVPAGVVTHCQIHPGQCARIFTGAPMPAGADAVVMQEDTQPLDGDRVRITDTNVKPRQWVFFRGTEMRAGDVVVAAGTVLNPAALGVLAGVGRAKAELFAAPRVSITATGNELVEPDWPREPGQIYNSNGPMLAAQVGRAGGEIGSRGMCGDNRDNLRHTIASDLADSDIVLLAGGVSVGKFDLVPAVLEELGVTTHFRQVRMKPGKPLLFGTKGDTLVFGLPGNPVSAYVCFELFVRPAIRNLMSHPDPYPQETSLPLAEGIAEVNDRPTYRPAKLELGECGWTVRPVPWAGAPDLRGMHPTDALVVLPPGETRLDRGQLARVVLMN